jgi:hypothetical protein
VEAFTTRYAMTQEWITDRLPTEADGDMDGDVRMRRAPGSANTRLIHWTFVWPGMDWQRTSFWEPPTETDRIAALEQRVAELEVFKKALMQPSVVSYSLGN